MKIISLHQYRQEKFGVQKRESKNKEIHVPALSELDATIRIHLFICYIKKEFDEFVPSYNELLYWRVKCEEALKGDTAVVSLFFSKVIENGLDRDKLDFEKAPKWFFTWSLHYFIYFKCKENPSMSKQEVMDKYGLVIEIE